MSEHADAVVVGARCAGSASAIAVTAQGIRDALHFGRLLGERAAPELDDRRRLDRALRAWERERNRNCREAYAWTNREGERDPALAGAMLDVFSRSRRFGNVLTPRLRRRLLVRALRSGRGRRDRRRAPLAGHAQVAIFARR